MMFDMYHKNVLLLLCVMGSMSCTKSPSPRDNGPSLKETTDWINDTYNPHPEQMTYKNHGINWREINHATQDELTTSLHIENCVATIEEKQNPNFPMAAEAFTVSNVQTVNMADLDPSRFKTEITSSESYGMLCNDPNLHLNCNQADIGLHTRNDRSVIKSHHIIEYPKLKGAEHQNVSDTMGDTVYLYVNDLEYLPRLTAALKREIELCGGKPSPF